VLKTLMQGPLNDENRFTFAKVGLAPPLANLIRMPERVAGDHLQAFHRAHRAQNGVSHRTEPEIAIA
jgi:hypothetical protein